MAGETETHETKDTHGETAAGTEAHGGATGVFPPMDTTKYPSQIFWLIVFFGLLYWLMKRILPRIGNILSARKGQIDGDLARAQALKDETEAALKSYEKALADARSSAGEIARDTRDAVTKDVDAQQAKVNATLASKISDAEVRIAKGKAKAMESVDAIASETAQDIVKALSSKVSVSVAKTVAAVKKPVRKPAKA